MTLQWFADQFARALVKKSLGSHSSSASAFRSKRRRQRLVLEQLEDRRALAANPVTIDLGTQPNNSLPRSFVEVNNVLYFSSATDDSGQELWRSDGTAAGTWMVKDINPSLTTGSYPTWMTNVNGTLFFAATDFRTSRTDLWKSDGTEAGTVLVDGAFGSADPSWLTNVGGTLYFSAVRQSSANNVGVELWKSDGTQAGTVVVRDIVRGIGSSSPTQLVNVSGTLFFSATTPANGTELWKSNGTSASTVLVREIAVGLTGSTPRSLVNVGGTLYFSANNFTNGYELWKSNGTSASTVLVRDITVGASGSYPTSFAEMNGTLFFDVGGELWKSAGTAATTVPVEAPATGSYSVSSLINVAGTLYFSAYGPSVGFELWKSDGTAAGTTLVKDVSPGFASSNPSNLQVLGTKVYFTADPGSAVGREIFTSDGTAAGTVLLKDINTDADVSSYPGYLYPAVGRIFFIASEKQTGRELWSTDGTPTGTAFVKDIRNSNGSSDIRNSLAIGSTVYFSNFSSFGFELWKTDGTAAGTVLVKDIAADYGSYPRDFVNVAGTLYFTANDGVNGRELWKSNGTAAGTVLVRNIAPANYASNPRLLTAVGSTLYFVADDQVAGAELWKSNGTSATTVLVKDIQPGANPSNINSIVAFGSGIYFTADDGVNGREVWKSNGTAAGTVLVKDIVSSGTSYPTSLTVVNSTLYFVANDGINGTELWKSNGTLAGTVIVKNLTPTPFYSSYPNFLTNVNGVLYFAAREANSNFAELFRSDGTFAGTVPVEGSESLMNNPELLTNVGGTLYFRAFSEGTDTGTELWKSNGTLAGTTLVKDVLPGPADANIAQFFNMNGQLIFTADVPNTGRELWKSDGTPAGTTLLADLKPGFLSSGPDFFNATTSKFFVVADDGTSGRELMVFSGNQAPVNTLPAAANFSEDFTTSVTGIVVSDFDSGTAPVEVTLSAVTGILNVLTSATGGVKAAEVTGNGTTSVTLRAPIAAINSTLSAFNGLMYTPPADFAGSDVLTVVTNDLGNVGLGGALSATGTIAITVVQGNDIPVLGVAPGPVNYLENGTVVIDALATVSDIDSPDFATGILMVSPGSISANDRVTVRNQGTAAGLIGLSGSTVSFGGVAIGTVTSGLTGGTLVIALNASATPTAVQALVRNITFRTLGDNPVATPRTLVFSLNDGDGNASASASVTIAVTPVNDVPTISLPGGAPTFVEDGAPVPLDATAVINDLDDNLSGGNLTVTVAAGGNVDDRLEIQQQGLFAGQISTSQNFVLFGTVNGPVVLGTFAGSTSGPLVVTFGSQVSIAGVQALMRSITFRTDGDTPNTTNRVVTARVTDGAAGNSATVSKTVSVTATNDAPRLIDMAAPVSYTENAIATTLSTTLTVLDTDSADLDTGVLAVIITGGATATDILEIRNQGNAAGQIGVVGANVSFGGVLLGTFTGGTASAPLVITLNSTATPTSVNALMRNIGFRNSSESPSPLPRTVQFQISDGDGGASFPITQSVTVVSVNDRPVVSSIPSTATYVENASPIFVAPTGLIADVDSLDFQSGNLTIRLTAGATADDRLTIVSQGFAAGQIAVAGSNVLYGGVNIGTVSSTAGIGATPLVVQLNANANLTSTRALLRRVGFSNVSDNPATIPRVLQVLVNDGDTGTSLGANQTISVTAVNDAPTITLTSAVPTYTLAGPAVDIDSAAVLDDPDSANLAGGTLTVSLSAGGTIDDVLAIRNEGSGVNQIGLSGNNVTFGGVTIGSFTGGTSSVPLVITFNVSATPVAIQALARKITFSVTGTSASTTQRTITFQVTDGDGGTSLLVNKLVNVSV